MRRRFLCLLVMGFAWTVGHQFWAADTSAQQTVQTDPAQAVTAPQEPTKDAPKDAAQSMVIKIPSVHVLGTCMVARIDFTKIDPETTITQLETLYAKWVESDTLTDEQQAFVQQQWKSFVSQIKGEIVPNTLLSKMLATDPAAVAKDLGLATMAQVRDVFGVDRMTLFIGRKEPISGIAPVGIAMNKAENPNLNRTVLAALALSGEFFIAEDSDTMAVFPCRSYIFRRSNMAESYEAQTFMFMLRTSFGALPKRFVETLNASELDDMAIQCVMDPASLMKDSHFTWKISETFGKPALRAAQSTRTLSIGVDPNTLRWVVSCQTDKASSAKLVQTVLVEKFGKTFAGSKVTEADRKAFLERLFPAPVGTTFTLRFDPTLFDDPMVSRVCSTLIGQWCDEVVVNLERSQSLTECQNHLKQILLAMHCYLDSNGYFPPVYTVNANGRPLHSWRVLLLPYLEQTALYDQIRLDEPWDSDWNRQFHDQMPEVFRCEAALDECTNPQSETVYSLITGPDSNPLPLSNTKSSRQMNGRRGMSMEMITDGTSNTMAIAERKKPVCWMQPNDADISDAAAYEGIHVADNGIGAHHGVGPHDQTPVAMYDGSARNIPISLPLDILKAMITRAGGETVSLYDHTNRQYEKMLENTYRGSVPAAAAAPAYDDDDLPATAAEATAEAAPAVPVPAADDDDDYVPAAEPAPAVPADDYYESAPAAE